jgi:hypothetical protein
LKNHETYSQGYAPWANIIRPVGAESNVPILKT